MIDLLYLCHGRIEFTQKTLATLLANTNWDLVDHFVVYNDRAPDGAETTNLLHTMLPEGAQLRLTNIGSPVGVTNHFLWRTQAKIFAKIDNDIMVPPGWLEAMLSVMEHDSGLALLGMEMGMSGVLAPETPPECYTYMPARNIGGVGLMRRKTFEENSYPRPNGRFGFTEWQHHYKPTLGWIEPDLRVFSLDQVPVEHWMRITDGYREVDGLQRNWSTYPPDRCWYWEWANLEGEA